MADLARWYPNTVLYCKWDDRDNDSIQKDILTESIRRLVRAHPFPELTVKTATQTVRTMKDFAERSLKRTGRLS